MNEQTTALGLMNAAFDLALAEGFTAAAALVDATRDRIEEFHEREWCECFVMDEHGTYNDCPVHAEEPPPLAARASVRPKDGNGE